MPAPTNADELLDLLQKSNLVDEAKLRAYVQKLRDSNSLPSDPNKFAGVLVRDAVLTYFQAEQLLQGKYKRFSLGKYKVLERLGSGGMGHVFLCEHKLMRRRVAVKVLPVLKAEDKASLDRFYREAKAAAAVDHPNIVRAYDIDQDENLHFLVMEWVDGTNLQDLVKKFGPLDVLRACHYIYGAAVGLQHAHEIGLIHRDIKPGNILIDRSGVVKILDMGLARLTQDTEDNLTRMNDENVLGTADYLAPEQALDSHTVDIRADIYSLGATFYFLLTGSAPFPEGSVAQKLIWHQNRPPRPLKSLRADVPDDVVAVVEKMMAKKPEDRYQTPSDVMTALSGWMSTPIPPPAEREMPTLSPAIAGDRSNRPSAVPATIGVMRPMPAGPATFSGLPTVIASNTPAPAPVATVTPTEPGVWSTLGGETQSGQRGDTDRPDPLDLPDAAAERSSRVRRRAQTTVIGQKRSRKRLLYVALGALILVAIAVGVYLAIPGTPKEVDQGKGTPHAPTARKITVTKAGGENAVGSLREALNKANPGETIVIADARIVEPWLRLDPQKHKGLIIESGTPDGKPAVIEFSGKVGAPGLDAARPMLELNAVDGVKVRNVEFDAKGVLDTCVQVNGTSPGVTLENVTARGALKAGFRLLNAAGEAARPITLDRVRVLLGANTDGVVSHAAGTNLENKFIVIQNSRFEGPGRCGVRVEGSVLDLEVSNNRFFHVHAAFALTRPNAKPARGNITNNTISQAQIGVWFDVPGPEPKNPDPKAPPPQPVPPVPCELRVTLNYFANTNALLQSPAPVTGLVSENNLHDGATPDGSPPLTAAKTDAALPAPNPDQDATFLRFPADKFPTVGPTKARVGANPP